MRKASNHALGFNKLSLTLVAVVVGIFGFVMLFQSRAAEQNPGAPSVYLTPTDETYAANQEFTVNVRANSGNTPVNAVAAVFTYPQNLVEYVSTGITNSPYVTKAADQGGSGIVRLESGIQPGGDLLTGDQFVGRVTFRTKTSSGTINLAFTDQTILLNANTFDNILLSSDDRVGSTMSVDTTAPTVSISSPPNNQSIARGTEPQISVSATDNSSVSSVDILVDGNKVATIPDSPYEYTWDTSGTSLGNHTIQANARDSYGNTASSQTISVNVVDRSDPSVALTAPNNNETVSGNVPISADATDESGGTGIAKVDFLINNEVVSSDSTRPYSYEWDSTSVNDGNYTVTARAYDKASPANAAPSQSVTINVDNTDDIAPSTPTNFRATSKGLDRIVLAWGASTDNEGVTGYIISRNGTEIATTDKLTFTDTGLADSTSYNYSIVAIDRANNSSSSESISVATTDLKIGDFNKDGIVELADLAILLAKWGSTEDPNVDLSDNGTVDIVDLSIFLSNYPKS